MIDKEDWDSLPHERCSIIHGIFDCEDSVFHKVYNKTHGPLYSTAWERIRNQVFNHISVPVKEPICQELEHVE